MTYDSSRELWNYSYRLTNESSAQQDIMELGLEITAPDRINVEHSAPAGWHGLVITDAALGRAVFLANVSNPAGGEDELRKPRPRQIHPGGSLAGFSITSPFPPGWVRVYVRGFAQLPYVDPETYPMRVPADTTDAQRGWTLGPVRYKGPIEAGGGEPTSIDQLVGFMSLRAGVTHPSPVPVALKFGAGVASNTFQASLNGEGVTAAFHSDHSGGADLIGSFTLGSSPLRPGTNTLLVTVGGNLADGGPLSMDRDVLLFTVPEQSADFLRQPPR